MILTPLKFTDSTTGQIYYESQEKQSLFHHTVGNRAKTGITDILYGGAAKGGKSHALRYEAHNQCLSNRRIRGLLLRTSFPELKRTHLAKIRFDLPQGLLKYNSLSHEVYYFETESVLEFGYGRTPKDLEQYLSAEYDFIMIDEMTTTPFDLVLVIRSRLAASNPGYVPFFAGASNPGSISHRQVKSFFIDRDFSEKFPDEATDYDPGSVAFIPARIYDNPKLIERDPGIVKRLQSLKKIERMRFFEGNWDIFEGQFFDNFYRPVHVIKGFDIPSEWHQLNTFDFGNTCASHHLAMDPMENLYVSHEWFIKNKQLRNIRNSWVNKFIRPYNLGVYQTIGDTNLFAIQKLFDVKYSPAQTINRELKSRGFRPIVPVVKKMKYVKTAAQSETKTFRRFCNWYVKDLLDYKKDKRDMFIYRPKLFIFECCKYLIDTLPSLIIDPNDLEDILPKQDDHAYDSLKMGVITLKPYKILDEKEKESVAGVVSKSAEDIESEVI